MLNDLTTQLSLSLPSWGLFLFALTAAIGILPKSERFLRGLTTYIHEMGHALTAIILGRTVTAIKVDSWLGGHTAYVGKRNLANIIVSWSGYGAPGSLLLILVTAYATGLTFLTGVVWSIILFAAMFLQRSFFGIIMTLLGITLFSLVALYPQALFTIVLVFSVSGAMLGNGIAAVYLLKQVRKSAAPVSRLDNQIADSEYLARWTGIPARLWEYSWLIFLLATIVVFTMVILFISYN